MCACACQFSRARSNFCDNGIREFRVKRGKPGQLRQRPYATRLELQQTKRETWPTLMKRTKPTRPTAASGPTCPRVSPVASVTKEPPAQTTVSGTAAIAGPAPPSTCSLAQARRLSQKNKQFHRQYFAHPLCFRRPFLVLAAYVTTPDWRCTPCSGLGFGVRGSPKQKPAKKIVRSAQACGSQSETEEHVVSAILVTREA